MVSPEFRAASQSRRPRPAASGSPSDRSVANPGRGRGGCGGWGWEGAALGRAMCAQPKGFGRPSHPAREVPGRIIAPRRSVRHNAAQPAREAGWRRGLPGRSPAKERPPAGRSTHGPGVAGRSPTVPSTSKAISTKRRRQISAVLLGAFALLSSASVATFHRPGLDDEFWQSPNACGPVGAGLAWLLAWAFGHAAAFLVPVVAAVWAWNRLRDEAMPPLLLKTSLAALLVFEVCVLLGLG